MLNINLFMHSASSFNAPPQNRFHHAKPSIDALHQTATNAINASIANADAQAKIKLYMRDLVAALVQQPNMQAQQSKPSEPSPSPLKSKLDATESPIHRQVLRQLQTSEVSSRGEWHVRLILEADIFPNCVIDLRGSLSRLSADILYADPELEASINEAGMDLEKALQATTSKEVSVRCEQKPLHQLGIET